MQSIWLTNKCIKITFRCSFKWTVIDFVHHMYLNFLNILNKDSWCFIINEIESIGLFTIVKCNFKKKMLKELQPLVLSILKSLLVANHSLRQTDKKWNGFYMPLSEIRKMIFFQLKKMVINLRFDKIYLWNHLIGYFTLISEIYGSMYF